MKKNTDIETAVIDEFNKHIRISFCARRQVMMIGKGAVRALDFPSYIKFRVNENWDSLIISPCDSKDVMSFKVPRNLLTGHNYQFRIASKQFIHELVMRNGLKIDMNYMVPGILIEKQNVVKFDIPDAYEHSYVTKRTSE